MLQRYPWKANFDGKLNVTDVGVTPPRQALADADFGVQALRPLAALQAGAVRLTEGRLPGRSRDDC
jgi:hypothetical protein